MKFYQKNINYSFKKIVYSNKSVELLNKNIIILLVDKNINKIILKNILEKKFNIKIKKINSLLITKKKKTIKKIYITIKNYDNY